MVATDIRSGQQNSSAELESYSTALDVARRLSLPLRLELAQAILQSMGEELPRSKGKTTWMDHVHNRLSSGLPAPSDAEMQQWLDEYRTEKYG